MYHSEPVLSHRLSNILSASFSHTLWFQDDTFLEDVNMILNTGDIPNLYDNEERLEIIEKVSAFMLCLIFNERENRLSTRR